MSNKEIILSESQEEALDVIFKKFMKIANHEIYDKYASLSGFAGTGKTTIMSFLAKKIHNEGMGIHWCCPTGKAASVLRKKLSKGNNFGKYTCTTIHSLIYRPMKNKVTKKLEWARIDELELDCIIIDEASMVPKDIFEDLCSFRLPIICVGDSGQLPAIGEQISLVADADYTLTEIHRQALDSPIIKLSMDVREKGYIDRGVIGKGAAKMSRIFDKNSHKMIDSFFINKAMKEDSIILCGMHKTRISINKMVRMKHGLTNNLPMAGDKLVCIRNCKAYNIFNGNIGFVEEVIEDLQYIMKIKIKMDDGLTRILPMFKPAFNIRNYNDLEDYIDKPEYTNEIKDRDYFKSYDELTVFDFGCALSVWKAQGSEWNNVLFIEERNRYQSDDDYKRFLYTGITRASEKLGIVEDF